MSTFIWKIVFQALVASKIVKRIFALWFNRKIVWIGAIPRNTWAMIENRNCLIYLSDGHSILKWSNIFITGPHLSWFESSGHSVTVGKETPLIGCTRTTDLTGCVSHAKKIIQTLQSRYHTVRKRILYAKQKISFPIFGYLLQIW